MSIYNILGEKIKVLVYEIKKKGYHTVEVNLENIPSGVYYYRIKAGKFISSKKLVLVK